MNANDVLGGLVEKINGVDVYKKAEATQAAVNALPLLLEVVKAAREARSILIENDLKAERHAIECLGSALARLDEGVRP